MGDVPDIFSPAFAREIIRKLEKKKFPLDLFRNIISEETLLHKATESEKDFILNYFKQTIFKCSGDLYELRTTPPIRDIFCFKCHRMGDVKYCGSCHRVFHSLCDVLGRKSNDPRCCLCINSDIQQRYNLRSFSMKTLNVLIKYIISDLEIMMPTITFEPIPKYNCLISKHVNLQTMREKAINGKYQSFSQLMDDAYSMDYNLHIVKELDSVEVKTSKKLLKECEKRIKEGQQCSQCYIRSNEACNEEMWFAQTCTPAHKLVFVKIKNKKELQPAKVILEYDKYLDVRFFGNEHLRFKASRDVCNEIPPTYIVPDSKRHLSAYKELEAHITLLYHGIGRRRKRSHQEMNDRAVSSMAQKSMQEMNDMTGSSMAQKSMEEVTNILGNDVEAEVSARKISSFFMKCNSKDTKGNKEYLSDLPGAIEAFKDIVILFQGRIAQERDDNSMRERDLLSIFEKERENDLQRENKKFRAAINRERKNLDQQNTAYDDLWEIYVRNKEKLRESEKEIEHLKETYEKRLAISKEEILALKKQQLETRPASRTSNQEVENSCDDNTKTDIEQIFNQTVKDAVNGVSEVLMDMKESIISHYEERFTQQRNTIKTDYDNRLITSTDNTLKIMEKYETFKKRMTMENADLILQCKTTVMQINGENANLTKQITDLKADHQIDIEKYQNDIRNLEAERYKLMQRLYYTEQRNEILQEGYNYGHENMQ